MRNLAKPLATLWTLLLLALVWPNAATAAPDPRQPVILISIDGFRPDYLDKGITPTLNQMKATGASARMRPSFPTKTFPNHYTLVTGLRPDRHGIVGNSMIDPRRPGQMFSLGDARQSLDPFWWTQAEPIWITAEKAGVRSATMFWPGSEIGFPEDPANKAATDAHALDKSGIWRPSDWVRFDQNVTDTQRVDTVVDWMRRPARIRPRFVTLYFDRVDTAGHKFGPVSKEVDKEIAAVDRAIGRLSRELRAMGLKPTFVVVSDHGMAASDEARVIQLDTLIDRQSYIAVETGPYAAIEPAAGTDTRVYDALLKPHDHMTCYRKEDFPPRLAWGQNARVAAIICLANDGWTILSGTPAYPVTGGNHGWDNQSADMDALFLATGPAIRAGARIDTFDNVSLYPMLARLIGVTPRAHDGDAKVLEGVVR